MKEMKSLITIKKQLTDRTDAIDAYFRDVNQYERVSITEEFDLARAYRGGDMSARKKLITANLRFVVSVAKQYSNLGVPLADLISAGNVGLVIAAGRFDETRGFKFISYAVWWIRQTILQEIANNGRLIRVPINAAALNTKYWRENGEDMPEIAKLRVSSLNYKIGDSEDELINSLPNTTFKAPDQSANYKHPVHVLIMKLTQREQKIIRLRYGIDGDGTGMSYNEIAYVLNMEVNGETIRLIHEKAIRKLKRIVKDIDPEILFDSNDDK